MGKSKLGLPIGSLSGARKPQDTYEFLEYAHSVGAAGIQAPLTSLEPAYIDRLRSRAAEHGMWIELHTSMPHPDGGAFRKVLLAAKRAGALCVRSGCVGGYLMTGIIPNRRYEQFNSLEEWREFNVVARKAIGRAAALAEELKMPVAMENHKDWTAEEIAPIYKEFGSDYFGCCLDVGNNLSLLDMSEEVVDALLPFAKTCHLKDLGVAPVNDGFEMAEVVLGTGMLDVKGTYDKIRRIRPGINIHLEVIARNPLFIPCLTDKYWITFPNRNGLPLARTLHMVSQKQMKLTRIDNLSRTEHLALEQDNIVKSLAYISGIYGNQ